LLHWDFGTVRVALAGLLLVASVLKSEQLWSSSLQPFASPTFALILFEFAFAAWLLTGWLPRFTWWLAAACFAAFALVAGAKTLSGQRDCGCFGAVHLPPILALAIDLVALVALGLCRSSIVGPNSMRPHFAGLVLLVGLPAVAQRWVSNESQLVQVAPGVRVSAGVGIVDSIVDPSQWTPGMPFALLPYIDVGEELGAGDWTVVLMRPGCASCEALAQQLASTPSPSTVTVSVAPLRHDGNEWARGYLRGPHEWLIDTPLVLKVRGGLFVGLVSDFSVNDHGENRRDAAPQAVSNVRQWFEMVALNEGD